MNKYVQLLLIGAVVTFTLFACGTTMQREQLETAREVPITREMVSLLPGRWEGKAFINSGATSWDRTFEIERGYRQDAIRMRRIDADMRIYYTPKSGMSTVSIIDGRIGRIGRATLYERDGQYMLGGGVPEKGRWWYTNAPPDVNEKLAAYERGELVAGVQRQPVEPVPDIREGYRRARDARR